MATKTKPVPTRSTKTKAVPGAVSGKTSKNAPKVTTTSKVTQNSKVTQKTVKNPAAKGGKAKMTGAPGKG